MCIGKYLMDKIYVLLIKSITSLGSIMTYKLIDIYIFRIDKFLIGFSLSKLVIKSVSCLANR